MSNQPISAFTDGGVPSSAQFVGGYDTPGANGNRKWSYANILTFIKNNISPLSSAVITITGAALQQKVFTTNSGSALTIDQVNGAYQDITLNSATPVLTLQSVTASEGQTLIIRLIQDSTGGRLPTWSNVTWKTGVAPTINTGINASTFLEFNSNGVTWYGESVPQGTGTGPIVQQNGATLNQPNIVGVTDGSNATAGSVGEVISASLASGSAVTVTTATVTDVISGGITLSAGDWDISAICSFNGTITGTQILTFIGTASGNSTTGRDTALNTVFNATPPTSSSDVTLTIPNYRVSIASSTTYYLKANGTYTVGTLKAYGSITARRRR